MRSDCFGCGAPFLKDDLSLHALEFRDVPLLAGPCATLQSLSDNGVGLRNFVAPDERTGQLGDQNHVARHSVGTAKIIQRRAQCARAPPEISPTDQQHGVEAPRPMHIMGQIILSGTLQQCPDDLLGRRQIASQKRYGTRYLEQCVGDREAVFASSGFRDVGLRNLYGTVRVALQPANMSERYAGLDALVELKPADMGRCELPWGKSRSFVTRLRCNASLY